MRKEGGHTHLRDERPHEHIVEVRHTTVVAEDTEYVQDMHWLAWEEHTRHRLPLRCCMEWKSVPEFEGPVCVLEVEV